MKNKVLANKMSKILPHFASGKIVKGFGRGSKELGIPTANFPIEVIQSLPAEIETGIYFGWAKVDDGEVHKMVMSIGWNPYFVNKEKSMETHILHDFKSDLYGQTLRVCIVDYLRPELNFNSLNELIDAINGDIEKSKIKLDDPEYIKFSESDFFKDES